MNSLGFGLERIGTAAMARPLLFFSGIVVMTVAAIVFMFSVSFNGSVTGVLPKTSENFVSYENQKREFRNFSRDVAVIVRSDRLQTASGLEDLRNFQLDLSLTEGVLSAVSIMAVPEMNPETGEFQTYFPAEFSGDVEANERLNRILQELPQANALFSREENIAMVLVALDLQIGTGHDAEAFKIFAQLKEDASEIAPDDFEILYSGLTPIGVTILDTLLKDQARLTVIGLLLGAGIAVLFFRSIVAAVFCAVPPILTAIWAIGFFGITGVPITYMTTILPTLALVLAYADGIVMFHRWNKMNRDGDPSAKQLKANLREAVLKVGPASALTSLTTAFALSSFALSNSEALVEFAWVGVVLVLFAFLAVIVSVPVLGLAVIRLGWVSTGARISSPFRVGEIAAGIYESAPKVIAALALLIVAGFFYVHNLLVPDYRVTDLLPRESNTLEAERVSNEVFGGRSLVFLSIPAPEAGNITNPANRQRLERVTNLMQDRFGKPFVFSIDALWRGKGEELTQRISEKIQDAPAVARDGYISKDGTKMLISVRIPSSQSIAETQVMLKQVSSDLETLPFGDEITVTGFPVLLATEFSAMINELRTNLIVAALLGIILIGIASRSIWCALVVAVPNLFPILFVEAIIYFSIGRIGVTEVVALTLAFGIAIDNAVHVINVFRARAEEGVDIRDSLRFAVSEVAPALSASTMIICAGTAVALTSTLPILTTICGLIICTLVIALITNLVLLPANILSVLPVWTREK